MAFPKAPAGLHDLVKRQFAAAKDSNALTYYPTEVDVLNLSGVPFQLRFSQALAHKPKGNSGGPKTGESTKPFDPFESPTRDLFISDLAPAHKLVLNKFAVVSEHFILATSAFKEQTHLLEEDDLAATWACIQAYRDEGKELFAFFNCGEHSGASQRHRHIQLLPVESMREGLAEKEKWSPLVNRLTETDTPVPFATFAAALPADLSASQLHEIYLDLYVQASTAAGVENPALSGEAQVSYNIGMTDKAIVLCPRRVEGIEILANGSKGFVGLNGTVLAGTLLVKTEMEWKTLREDRTQLENVLAAIGYPTQSPTVNNNHEKL